MEQNTCNAYGSDNNFGKLLRNAKKVSIPRPCDMKAANKASLTHTSAARIVSSAYWKSRSACKTKRKEKNAVMRAALIAPSERISCQICCSWAAWC